MRSSILLVSALAASAFAAPTYPSFNVNSALPGDVKVISDYFNMLAHKVQEGRSMSLAPVCDLSKAVQPTSSPSLPAVTTGLTLKHVAIGRGTQNYTCDTTNATAAPVAIGAVATLFNASCVAAAYPDLLNLLPGVALRFNLTQPESPHTLLAPSNLVISGKHFFETTTTPFFNLDTDSLKLGEAPCSKNASVAAPADAPKGQQGEAAVPWLKLLTKDGATGNLQEVYRLETAGGSAPATCNGQPASFEVQYAAQYWFYEGTAKNKTS
ncbi:malate dehydrogenase [Pleurostoma richardsiae]|uniref:Malate dehydrogenase n=1 Tax=Pleurostoma richardsiae TaxID=41990 RepID=A0AA38RCB2_9PEZI|nr:malate dehydrogenase [Pleurostoma richardsiae]